MVRLLTRIRRRQLALSPIQELPIATGHHDPTRPGAARIRDGVPIAHVGPPGFPGRPPVPGDLDADLCSSS